VADAIKIDGLAEFVRNLKKMDRELPKSLRVAFNTAADTIVTGARARVPSRSGRARGSVRAKSTQTAVRIAGGGSRAPYYPWLDFGGRVGRKHSVHRPFLRDGRYIYATFYDNVSELEDLTVKALLEAAAAAGIEVD